MSRKTRHQAPARSKLDDLRVQANDAILDYERALRAAGSDDEIRYFGTQCVNFGLRAIAARLGERVSAETAYAAADACVARAVDQGRA